ncbi:twin-arginine translocation pathway signal protein [Burkholderia stagnalis]|uniref:twin-arginine translocation pathway signal protein n=1 Tax=Burkholderia stagnalis TaxID=1503054 RepID=UPI000F5B6E66|nr:twin-arginine translocation pathway signal protein [Burkholderia stagnalis]RQQ88707.1 twin-arginine translocation pathway signal protein [Burkholderia stagnalis]
MNNIAPASGQPLPNLPFSSSRVCGWLLAALASGTSLWISIVAGDERGGLPVERAAWAAIGVVLLLGAHLIPALTRGTGVHIRVPAMALWALCMVSTGYGHATFFLAAQRHAGDVRATKVHRSIQASDVAPAAGRSQAAIARDQARVTQQLAVARNSQCVSRCDRLIVRRETLSAKLAALDVEAAEARRREQAVDRARIASERQQAREELARIDPVTARAAEWLNASRETVDLLVALVYGSVLECVACLGWLLALPPARRDASGHLQPSIMSDRNVTVARHALVTGSQCLEQERPAPNEASNSGVTPSHCVDAAATRQSREGVTAHVTNSDLLRLTRAIAVGQVRPTVKEIRTFLKCSQDKAMRLRRQFLAMMDDGPSTPQTAAVRVRSEQRPRLVHSSSGRPWAA